MLSVKQDSEVLVEKLQLGDVAAKELQAKAASLDDVCQTLQASCDDLKKDLTETQGQLEQVGARLAQSCSTAAALLWHRHPHCGIKTLWRWHKDAVAMA